MSPESDEETDGDEVKHFSRTKIEYRITKATFAVGFEDAVATMREKFIVLKEHNFVKRIQNEAYNFQKDGLRDDDLLVLVDFANNYCHDQQSEIETVYFGHQSFSVFISCCY